MFDVKSKHYKSSDDTDKSIQIALRDINERLVLIEQKIQELERASHTH